ncbi:MAG TPA: HAMP domain-containing sensor histidine kinase [Polyangiales bacterium]|nr:HAMP domain-containing sensor histidine kinase [Polyangiales bacterium]
MSFVPTRERARGLSFRLNAWYAFVLVLVFSLAALGAHASAARSIEHAQRVLVETTIAEHRARIEHAGLSGLRSYVETQRERTSVRSFVRVSDDAGNTILFDAPSASVDFSPDDLQPRAGTHEIWNRKPGGTQPWHLASTQLESRLWLQVGVEDSGRREQLADIERALWLLLLLGLGLGLVGGVLVTRRALAPLRALVATSRRIVERGELSARVPLRDSRDELDELSQLFNRALDRNQRLVEGMRQALDNVAHDLRTPLSSLRSSAELALQRENDPVLLREALADCVEDSERVLSMLRTLMDISEAETGVMRLSLAKLSLTQLTADILDLYQHVAEDNAITLRGETREPVWVMGDRDRLLRAVSNLVDNAIKYTERGGSVTVAVAQRDGRARLTVSDTGSGIEPVHLEKIWERLYRADQSRSRRGLGLGLSFVKAIIEAHGGTVSATSTKGLGSTFSAELPATAADATQGDLPS